MKLNTIQKFILLIILLLMIVSFLFFIPYREYNSIVYKSIAYSEGKIDFIRVIIQTSLILLIGFFLFFSTTNFLNINWQSLSVKKIIKRELKYIGLFVLCTTIICSIIYLINIYQIRKRSKIEYLISIQNQSQDSISNLVKKKDLLKENFAYDIGQIISYSKDPYAIHFKNLLTNHKETLNEHKESSNPFKDNTNTSTAEDVTQTLGEKSYFIFDSIVSISNKNESFLNFLNMIKEIKIGDLKHQSIILSNQKYNHVKINSSKDILSQVILQNENNGRFKNDLEIYLIKIVISKLPYYQELANKPELFSSKINDLISTENTYIIEFNSIIDRKKALKTKLMQTSFLNSDILEPIFKIVALCLLIVLFIFRYFVYSIKKVINYLK
jgi:hypothetical protein